MRTRTRGVLCLAIVALLAKNSQAQLVDDFEKIFPLDGIAGYTVEEMVENCGGKYLDAKARLWLYQSGGESLVIIAVRSCPPKEVFTVWLKLAAPNPLTGRGITALANPEDTEDLAKITPDSDLTASAEAIGLEGDDGTGAANAANAFRTDKNGNGFFFIHLKYPLIRGAFQFGEFDESLSPMAIGTAPFTLRLASHCTDHKAHGLVPGKHEMFFDWSWTYP